jgi:hypothetical protein
MNESPLSPYQSTTTSLRYLQEILQNRIIQKKREIHPSHNKASLENLWTEIETSQWILSETQYQKTTRGAGRAAEIQFQGKRDFRICVPLNS